MSKRWLNPPLTLLSTTNGDERSKNLDGHARPLHVDSLQQASTGSGFPSPRDSDTQYAIAGLPNHYMDLPSAVPFQYASPALPSAEFPISARGFLSPPDTSSTTDFPSTSVHPSAYQSPTPEIRRQSNPSIRRELTVHAPSAHQTINSGVPGATVLSPADSSVSHNSVWNGEDLNQHSTLDITQFPGPPDSPSDDQSSPAPASSILGSFNPLRRLKQLRLPASPLYEESEPSASRPPTPGPVALRPNDAPLDPRQASGPTSSLLPSPSPAATSVRGSFLSHLTAASRGSSSPRLSITEERGQSSILEGPGPTWDHVMSSVNQNWNPSRSVANQASALTSSAASNVLSTSVIGTSSSDQDGRNILVVPTRQFASTRSPMSGESNSDIYSAIGRMSFPRPPQRAGGDELSPISSGTPRTPWITGVTLKTRNRDGSLGRQESLKSTMKNTLATPAIPLLPSSAASTRPNVSSLEQSLLKRHDEAAYSSGKESKVDSPGLEVPVESRGNTSWRLSDNAPSYDRRVSDLVRATAEPPKRGSMVSVGTTLTTDSQQSSVDGAVVGVARTASLSTRVRALLTRGPSLNAGSQEVTMSYLVPSPLPSTQPSQISLPLGDSAAPLNMRSSNEAPTYEPLQPLPETLEYGDDTFPESVGSPLSSGDGEEIINLHRIRSHDSPHSAIPLNQSTPFQNYFPTPTIPTTYWPVKVSRPPTPSEASSPTLSRPGSRLKSRRSPVLSTLARTPSRVAKTMSWFRKKPLPPSPPKEKYENALPNPDDILTRQDFAIRVAVNQGLNVGELPYTSPIPSIRSILISLSDRARADRRRASSVALGEPGLESNTKTGLVSSSASRRTAVYFILGLFAIMAIITPIGVVFGLRARSTGATVFTCAGGVMTGTFCELNSTCVCTSSVSGKCEPAAQALLDLIPPANSLFGMNLTAQSLALALWDLQGDPASNCASQAILVDVAPALNETASPNRTQWARTAILYNLVQTNDLTSTATLRNFIRDTDFSSLHGQDGPVTNESLNMSVQSSGFVFDFAAMTHSPTSVEWIDNSGVDQLQRDRVGYFADGALNRMYSFATASSIQRSTALTRYWTEVLQLHESDVARFVSAISIAPVILPFDTSSDELVSFLASTTDNQGISLPAPVACLPGVPQQGRSNLDLIEQNAFGLTPLATSPSTLKSNCFPDHPLYGVLDLLRLRRPFDDGRTGMRIPSAQLITDAAPRVVLHSGEQLVGLTSLSDHGIATQTNFTVMNTDPREYGTLQHLNHIALSWLQAFPNLTLATLAAQFVLDASNNTAPPAGSTLFDQTDSLADFPVIEVSVFGSVLPTDIETFRADFGAPNGTLFFGSRSGDIFRHWALRDESDVILWSNSSTAVHVVEEHAANNTAFETIWSQASDLINAAAGIGRATGSPEIETIVSALQEAHLFA